MIINCLRRRFAHPLETGCPSGMQASEKTAAYAKTTSCAFWLSSHDPSSIKFLKLAEPLSATTIVIAGRHGQERISLRMLLPSEPLSCTMLSSSVCHANPLHVIMGVYMPTSTTAIPEPCYLLRQKHDAPHSISLPGTAVPLR